MNGRQWEEAPIEALITPRYDIVYLVIDPTRHRVRRIIQTPCDEMKEGSLSGITCGGNPTAIVRAGTLPIGTPNGVVERTKCYVLQACETFEKITDLKSSTGWRDPSEALKTAGWLEQDLEEAGKAARFRRKQESAEIERLEALAAELIESTKVALRASGGRPHPWEDLNAYAEATSECVRTWTKEVERVVKERGAPQEIVEARARAMRAYQRVYENLKTGKGANNG